MQTMEKRKIGRSPLEVSAVGLGLMSMSGIYGNANDEESISLIHYALDKGINLLDSADMYGWGHNEQLLGRALKGWRHKAIVATKFGQTKDASGKQGVDGRPEYVMQACEASLKRLGIDVIDLYYQHRPRQGRRPRGRPAPAAPALPGREPRQERAARLPAGIDRAREEVHARAARARLAARPGQRHRADPRHQAEAARG